MSRNKNRGAGLVTVVAVLAVSSILLSASIWLSFNHYKNVMTAETNDEELAELELCAEVVCIVLNNGESNLNSSTLRDILNSSTLQGFYNFESGSSDDDADAPIVVPLSENAELHLYPSDDTLLIQYVRGEAVIAEKNYRFETTTSGGKYVVSVLPPENDTEAEA